jgi:RES domain-containing protein
VSSSTWTPLAVASEAAGVRAKIWRAVEAQYVASTMRLVDLASEQSVLEEILEASKPPPPADVAGLDYLLATPFRYPPRPGGSRFRGPNDSGVFYGALEPRTACAELGYWRWRFVMDSDALRETGIGPVPHTVFQAGIDTDGINLTRPPFVRNQKTWTDPDSYVATQAFARVVREAGTGAIAYESVRDPEAGLCVAVLRPGALSPKAPIARESWMLKVSIIEVVWAHPERRFVFRFR